MKADVNRIGAPSKRNSRWKPTLVAPRGPRTDRRVAERKVPRENSGNSTESSGTKTGELSHALAPAQKARRSANFMTRGLPAREVILPAELLLKLLLGWPNCTVLVRLNTSQRNCMASDSRMGKSRIRAKSKTLVCGPRSALRPTSPRKPGSATGRHQSSGLQRRARTVLGNVIPTIQVPNDRRLSNTVGE